MLYTVCFVVPIFVCLVLPSSQFPILSCQVPLKMREIGTCKPEEQLLSWQLIISVLDQKSIVASRFSLNVDYKIVTFSRGADARQSVFSSKCFELICDRQNCLITAS